MTAAATYHGPTYVFVVLATFFLVGSIGLAMRTGLASQLGRPDEFDDQVTGDEAKNPNQESPLPLRVSDGMRKGEMRRIPFYKIASRVFLVLACLCALGAAVSALLS